MRNKIDEKLFSIAKTMSNSGERIDCLVYANNYGHAKKYLQKLYDNIIEYPFISAFGINTDFDGINKIAGLTQIKYISSVAKVFAQMNIAKEVMNISEVQKVFTGKGINIAVIDTGIAPHLDFCSFENRILHFEDFIFDKQSPYDDNGHGTFVCGVLAGNGFLSGKRYSGVAPNANIIMCKALDKKGETGSLTILKAMQWIYDNRNRYNIKVVCMSLGSQTIESGDPLIQGAEVLWNAGIVVVAAAGNSGPQSRTIKSPGASGKIITVGALDDGRDVNKKDFKIANFSSRGPTNRFYKPDCVASGVDSVCTSQFDEFYTKMSGTSVSTPIIAGSCALLLEKEPNLSPNQVKSKILSYSEPFLQDRNAEGFGVLNVKKLLNY